jgi:hypothetical protein
MRRGIDWLQARWVTTDADDASGGLRWTIVSGRLRLCASPEMRPRKRLILPVPGPIQTPSGCYWCVSDSVGSHTAAGCSVATAQVAGCGVVAELGSGAAGERRREILEMNGSAVLLSSWALVGEQDVVAMFQAARDSEYEEIPDKCRDFTQGWTRSRRQIISPTVRSRRTRSSW